jgi:hypothetical protein
MSQVPSARKPSFHQKSRLIVMRFELYSYIFALLYLELNSRTIFKKFILRKKGRTSENKSHGALRTSPRCSERLS